MKKNSSYIKTDDNTVLNEKYVRWIKQMSDDCLEVCSKSTGCKTDYNTHKICKSKSPESFTKLNEHFNGLGK